MIPTLISKYFSFFYCRGALYTYTALSLASIPMVKFPGRNTDFESEIMTLRVGRNAPAMKIFIGCFTAMLLIPTVAAAHLIGKIGGIEYEISTKKE